MADVKTLTVNNVTYNIKDETARQSLADVVHKTGDETIGGEKTFTEVMQGVAPDSNSNDGSIPTTAWVRNSLGLDYANPNLSNLNSEGKNIGNWSNNVSNCIVKDPNNIIYTFDNSGTFTLKAGSKVYVPDGNGGYIPVGEQWTELATTNLVSSSGSWSAVVYDGTKFLALSTASYISTSTDGTNWTTPVKNNTLSGGGRWLGIGYNGSKYVVITDRAYVSTSTDGVNWTEPVASGLPATYRPETSARIVTYSWESIAFGNNKWVTCSLNKDRIGYSSDGISWTVVSGISDSGSGCGFRNVVFGNGKFVVLGSYNGAVTTSANGTTWDHVFYPEGLSGSYGYWDGLAFDGSRFIAVSRSGYVSTSVDGITWTIPTKNIDQSLYLFSLSYSNNPEKLILVQEGGKTSTSVPVVVDKNFKAVTIQNDISLTADGIGNQRYVFVNESGTGLASWDNDGTWIYSGTSFPTGTGHGVMFYNTNDNTIRYTFNDGASWSDKLSFPIALIHANTAGTRLDRVGEIFDGIVWIGSHVALLPGLTLAFPDGRNPDGSCKNIIKTVNKVTISDLYSRNNDWLIAWGESSDINVGGWFAERFYTQFPKKAPEANDWMMVWDERRNQFFQSNNGSPYTKETCCVIGRYRRDGNTQYMPKSWEIKRAFRAIERFDILHMLDLMYPVGSIYLEASNAGSCPLAFVMQGSRWELVSNDRALWGGDGSNANSTIAQGLPNIWGEFKTTGNLGSAQGALVYVDNGRHNHGNDGRYTSYQGFDFNASRSNSIYNGNRVQPQAYRINVWRRVQ